MKTNNTKILVILCLVIVVSGVAIFWFYRQNNDSSINGKKVLSTPYFPGQSIASSIRPAAKLIKKTSYPITIRKKQTFTGLVDAGKYKYVGIQEKDFPLKPQTQDISTNVVFLEATDYMLSKDVVAEMDKMNLKPAGIEHLLSFAVQYPNLPSPAEAIYALGSTVDYQNKKYFGDKILHEVPVLARPMDDVDPKLQRRELMFGSFTTSNDDLVESGGYGQLYMAIPK